MDIHFSKSDKPYPKGEPLARPYPFQKYIDEQKHLDTDETRHLMKPIIHVINEDFKGQEHLYCDKSQLCPLGKYRRPKIIVEAEQRGFKTFTEMLEFQKKVEADAKAKEAEDLKNKLEKSQQDFDDYKKTMEARFDKLADFLAKSLQKA